MTFVFRDESGTYHPVKQCRYDKPFSEAFCKRAAAAGSKNMKFLLDGALLGRSQTPADVELCEGAVIDCVRGQEGGCAPRRSERPKKQVAQYDFGHETFERNKRSRAGQAGIGVKWQRDKKLLAPADVDEEIKVCLRDSTRWSSERGSMS